MSGITVGGGGDQAVDTPEMEAAAVRLGVTADAVDAVLLRLAVLPASTASVSGDADVWVDAAAQSLRLARLRAVDASNGLRLAAERYGRAEHDRVMQLRDVDAVEAAVAGAAVALARPFGIDLRPLVAVAATGLTIQAVVEAGAGQLLADGYIDPAADPELMRDLQARVSSLDDYIRAEHLMETPADPYLVDPARPASTERISATAADALPDATGLRVTPIPIDLQEVPGRPLLRPPVDLADLGSRLPGANPGEAQVRIEQAVGLDGRRRWVVFVAGTATFSPLATPEPFDLRANLDGVAGQAMASEQAVEAAMRAAGVRPGDPVLVIGHSQGALAATRLAQSGRFDVTDLVTLGGPTGQIPLPASVRVLAVEHTDDPIPRLGGEAATGSAGLRRIVVTRQAYADAPPTATGAAMLAPAHLPSEYVRTLAEIDTDDDARLARFRAELQPFLTGTTVSASLYRMDRLPAADGVVIAPEPVVPRGGAAPGR